MTLDKFGRQLQANHNLIKTLKADSNTSNLVSKAYLFETLATLNTESADSILQSAQQQPQLSNLVDKTYLIDKLADFKILLFQHPNLQHLVNESSLKIQFAALEKKLLENLSLQRRPQIDVSNFVKKKDFHLTLEDLNKNISSPRKGFMFFKFTTTLNKNKQYNKEFYLHTFENGKEYFKFPDKINNGVIMQIDTNPGFYSNDVFAAILGSQTFIHIQNLNNHPIYGGESLKIYSREITTKGYIEFVIEYEI